MGLGATNEAPSLRARVRRGGAIAPAATRARAAVALAGGILLGLALDPDPGLCALDLDTEARIVALEDARQSTEELLSLLDQDDAAVRARAALAVGRIGRVADIPRLVPLLRDPDAEVRRSTAFALGEIEDSTAAFPLEEQLLSGFEQDPEVRELAVEGLGKLGRGIDACRAALRDSDPAVQARALLAAWRIPGAAPLEEVLQLSRHKRAEIRWCAAYCLMRLMGAPPSGRTPIPESATLSDADRDRIAERLLRLTEEPDRRVVLQAVRGLRGRPESLVTARLLALLADPDWRVRVEAIRSLAAPLPDGTTRSVELSALRPLLDDGNTNVIATAIEALATIGGDETRVDAAEELLYELLSAPAPRHRELALGALAARLRAQDSGGEGAASQLPEEVRRRFFHRVESLAKDPIWSVSAACAQVGDLLPIEQRESFYLALAREESRIAKLAVGPFLEARDVKAPGWPDLAEFEPELSEFLGSRDPMVVLMTLEGLGAAYQRAVDDTSARASGNGAEAASGEPRAATDPQPAAGAEGTPDWSAFAALLERERQRALGDPLWLDVRQSIVGLAASRCAESPAMEGLLLRSTEDPNPLVRRAAREALAEAGMTPPPDRPEPMRPLDELRAVLEWAREDRRAVFVTSTGTFEVRLFSREAPLTCWNFAQLAEDGFFDGGAWHRVVPDFVLQDGCPRGDGWGGPPHQIRCEINRHRYGRGAMGMALSGKDTGGSQFFLTHAEQPHLDGGYTVFGELVLGREVAESVGQGDPIVSVRIERR